MSTDGHQRVSDIQDITLSKRTVSGPSSRPIPIKTDLFITSLDTQVSQDLPRNYSIEQKRDLFVSRRPKSLKDFFFKSRHNEKQTSEKNRGETKTKFSNIVTKHLLPLRFVRNLRSERLKSDHSDIASCPNLANRRSVDFEADTTNESSVTSIVRLKNNSETPVEAKISPLPTSQSFTASRPAATVSGQVRSSSFSERNPVRVQHLSIPKQPSADVSPTISYPAVDIFTTSFTRSTSPKTSQILTKSHCLSAQELPKSPIVVLKQRLIRSYSDTPPRPVIKSQSSSTSLNIATCLQSKMYRDDSVSQILDYLFIGSIEVAYNDPKLCRLKIDSLVDISNVSSAQVPSSKKLHCPCLCAQEKLHFRSRLIIQVADDEKEDIEQYFTEINKFIDGARKCGKNVLIFSYFGNSRAPAVAIQYLMRHENFLLRQAYNLVKNQRASVEINPGFQNTLETLEHTLFPEAKPSISFSNDYLNIADPQAIKCAWVDCTDM